MRSLISKEHNLRARNDFNSYLALEFLQHSRKLADKYNWRDSDYFAKKGLMIANNHEYYPEVPESWGVNADSLEEINVARKRLTLLLTPKIKVALPIQLAHLSSLYDCWVSSEEKYWNLEDLYKCKTRFLKLSKEIEEYMENLKPKEEIDVIDVKEPEFKKFDIYFDFNSYKFNHDANKEFFDLLKYLEDLNGNFRILLSGKADRKGKKIYNANLARKRMLVVKNMLIKNGVPQDLIETQSTGEVSPQIITKDNRRNKYNRLVGIYVLKGQDSLAPIPLPLIDSYIYKKEIENMKKNRGLDG